MTAVIFHSALLGAILGAYYVSSAHPVGYWGYGRSHTHHDWWRTYALVVISVLGGLVAGEHAMREEYATSLLAAVNVLVWAYCAISQKWHYRGLPRLSWRAKVMVERYELYRHDGDDQQAYAAALPAVNALMEQAKAEPLYEAKLQLLRRAYRIAQWSVKHVGLNRPDEKARWEDQRARISDGISRRDLALTIDDSTDPENGAA